MAVGHSHLRYYIRCYKGKSYCLSFAMGSAISPRAMLSCRVLFLSLFCGFALADNASTSANKVNSKMMPNVGCSQSSGISPTNSPGHSVKRRVGKIDIKTGAIFDESDRDSMAIHHFANWMHVNTKEQVVKERLPFKEGDSLDEDDLLEAERIIRSQPYIRDAKVTFKDSCDIDEPAEVEIQTWDNWSLIPTFSFGRKGGENKLSLGMKEDNILGSGIRTRLKYNSDVQRSGYQFTMKSALPYIPLSTVFVDFQDNDDGQSTQLEFDKPFYHLRSQNMFNIYYMSEKKTEDIFQNGLTRNSFDVENHRYAISTGWQLDAEENSTTRLKIGYADEFAMFEPNHLFNANDKLFLPDNRNYQYPWIGLEYLERHFKTMSEIYLINQTEDINLGWHHELKLGVELNDVAQGRDIGYHLNLWSSKGAEIDDGLILFSVKGEGSFNTRHPDYFLLAGKIEYFKRYTQEIGFYSRLNAGTSSHRFLDSPISIGDDSGVRGYPLQYQHGAHYLTSSIEGRFYTDYNILKILDLGFVAFADAGKAWSGKQAEFNETHSILSSIGVGVRLYSSHSSHKSVIHMDISKPFATSENVDAWEWRLQIKQSF